MGFQNQVILAIGSNLGDRLENITHAVQSIHETIGSVVKTSRVYETPALGFEAPAFLNCALVLHTGLDAQSILSLAQKVEIDLGRVKTLSGEYESRVIDIDVIAFNEDIIESDDLKVPHPQMEHRLFVLLPMRDLELDWRHPILQKHLPELLRLAEDQSICKPVASLKLPLEDHPLHGLNYIAIEGNIGAGKTSLSLKIAEDFNAKTVLERYADNPFLPKFYEDATRFAFPLEMSFLADRYRQISDDLAQFDLFRDFLIADYHIFKSLIFAQITLPEDEFRLYRKLFDIIYREIPKPDLYVYLYQNTDRLLQNIRTRGRDYEQDISVEYLENINRGYLDYIKSQSDMNILIIDVSDRDFLKDQGDYIFVLDEIKKAISVSG